MTSILNKHLTYALDAMDALALSLVEVHQIVRVWRADICAGSRHMFVVSVLTTALRLML